MRGFPTFLSTPEQLEHALSVDFGYVPRQTSPSGLPTVSPLRILTGEYGIQRVFEQVIYPYVDDAGANKRVISVFEDFGLAVVAGLESYTKVSHPLDLLEILPHVSVQSTGKGKENDGTGTGTSTRQTGPSSPFMGHKRKGSSHPFVPKDESSGRYSGPQHKKVSISAS